MTDQIRIPVLDAHGLNARASEEEEEEEEEEGVCVGGEISQRAKPPRGSLRPDTAEDHLFASLPLTAAAVPI